MFTYPFTFPKIGGRLVRRLNRFVVEADVGGRKEKAYLANPGRLWELLLPAPTTSCKQRHRHGSYSP
ncbi:MAG: hypothetical protein GX767_04065 [Firmicutes bacterium]|nr:hypothetical protein [Bacillota bacterium]